VRDRAARKLSIQDVPESCLNRNMGASNPSYAMPTNLKSLNTKWRGSPVHHLRIGTHYRVRNVGSCPTERILPKSD